MNPAVFGSDLWLALGGVFRLDGAAFVQIVALRVGPAVAVAIVLAAGFSEALGQSIVLFANRVRPARFFFSLLVDALLFTFGYAFLTASTWVVCRLPGTPHFGIRALGALLAASYAPLLFSFLGAMPYLGAGIMRLLRIWHLLAMVIGVAAVGRVDVFAAATYVWLGWLVMVLAQRSFGKPIAGLGARLLDAVAGVNVIDDASAAIGRVESGSSTHLRDVRVAVAQRSAKHPHRWIALVGLCGVALLTVLVALALEPVRQSIFGWQEHLPKVLQLPIDLLWLAIIGIVVSAFMAPLETLGWWAGWYGDSIDTSEAAHPSRPDPGDVARYVVYLDGIAQSSSTYTPDIETFLDALAPELPGNVRLVRGVMCYSVVNKPLDDDPIFSRFWKLVDAIRSKNLNSLVGMFVNLRNVTIVAVSADPRYGPMYNFGIASVIYKALVASGYRKHSGVPVTLLGYSGGGQMACGSAAFLKRALDAPVDVISLGGVISGDDPILQLEHLYHLVGEKDHVERLGPIMFASRWKIALLSYWNRAKRLGSLTEISLGPVGHQVPGGMLDPQAKLPDGRTNLRQTLDYVESILFDRLEVTPDIARKPSNYERYAAGAIPASRFAPDPIPAGCYLPVADWVGRLILPLREERFGGVWFEVRHAPQEHAALRGLRVRLRWSDDPAVRKRLRAAVRDLNFSAEAQSASTYGGLVMPTRLNRWRFVDPLESLAGAHPVDDVVVKLAGDVRLGDEDAGPVLRIVREPVQITGTYYGLLRFLGPGGEAQTYRALHFDANDRRFDGAEVCVRMPSVVPDCQGLANSSAAGIERSPLNADGWYVYGEPDAGGVFVVRALAPRALLRPQARRALPEGHAAYRYVRAQAWRDIAAAKGDVVTAATAAWRVGEAGLLVHTYGGIGGARREAAAVGPLYFGHFAYGIARVVQDPLAGEPRFEITYFQVYTQNTDGLVAGALDWSRYLGDRQFGWAGVRPVCDAILRHDAFDSPFDLAGGGSTSALEALALQLEVMTARYRIGDGTGGTFVGAANNCSQDSNRALFATLRALRRSIDARGPLAGLAGALRKQLQPFGAARRDWSDNEYDLGTTMEDAPIQNAIAALGSWRCILPRLAFDTIVGTFVRHGASLNVLGSCQIGGERPEIEPIPPIAL